MSALQRVIGLGLAGLIIACLAVGGAWAFLTDTETSNSNQVTAGTLDMVPTTSGSGVAGKYTVTAGGNEVNGNVVFTKMRPGESGSITWTLNDQGTIGGTLSIVSTITFSEGSSNEPETAAIIANSGVNLGLGDLVGIKVRRNGTYILGDASNYVPFSGLQTVLNNENQSMTASGTITYVFDWSVASDIKKAGADGKFGTGDDIDVNENLIQSDNADIDITFTLTQ